MSSLSSLKFFNRLSERPFSSEVKSMAVSGTILTPQGPSKEIYYIKGSIDSIINRCKFYYIADDSTPGLDSNTKSLILNKAYATASRGLRVIAMAYGHGSVKEVESSGLQENLVFVGFQAMYDPPRKGVADSIALLQSGGVQVVMITGDSEQTALYIARQLGLRVGTDHERGSAGSSYCLTGQAIDQMTKAQLKERVGTVSVFARTTPRHKMAIVEAFQSGGAVVAMTGDGGELGGVTTYFLAVTSACSKRCARAEDG